MLLMLALVSLLAVLGAAAPVKVAGNSRRATPPGSMAWLDFSISMAEVVVMAREECVTALIEQVGSHPAMAGLNCTAEPNMPWMRWACRSQGAHLPVWVVPTVSEGLTTQAQDLGFGLIQSYADVAGVQHYIFQQPGSS